MADLRKRVRRRLRRAIADPVLRRVYRAPISPGFHHYVERVRQGDSFAFVKRTHGFWDQLADLVETVPRARAAVGAARRGGPPVTAELLETLTPDEAELLDARYQYKQFWQRGFAAELVRDLQSPPPDDAYLEAVQIYPALHSPRFVSRIHRVFHTSGREEHDAAVWKQAVLDGELPALFDALRPYHVIMVGPDHLRSLGELVGLPSYEHVAIPFYDAPAVRERTLAETRQAIRDPAGTAVLFQAGAVAFWLIHRLWADPRPRFLLDLGRAVDVWYPAVADTQPWFVDERKRIVERMGLSALYDAS